MHGRPLRPRDNMKMYEDYYVNQAGGNFPVFSTPNANQRGHGLGNIFSSIGRAILPIFKSKTFRTIGKNVLNSGINFADDMIKGNDAKKSAVKRSREMGSNLLKAASRLIPPGEPNKKRARKRKPLIPKRRRRKRLQKDIFE